LDFGKLTIENWKNIPAKEGNDNKRIKE